MQLLVIIIEISGYVGPAFFGALYLSILTNTDFGLSQVALAALIGGFVWWLINVLGNRQTWRKFSTWVTAKRHK
jgi:hypothetical protein